METRNWKKLVGELLKENNETWDDVVSNTMSEEEMMQEFSAYPSYDRPMGCPFTIWTSRWVYFPGHCEEWEWVSCVSRNPNNKPTKHNAF